MLQGILPFRKVNKLDTATSEKFKGKKAKTFNVLNVKLH